MTRPSRDEPLQFAILGGFERGFGIFISRVERGTKAEEIGLKRGDQVINIYLLIRIFSMYLHLLEKIWVVSRKNEVEEL